MHLYHYVPDHAWYLNHAFTPHDRGCEAFCASRDGLLPVGEQMWTVFDSGWKNQSLTITLLTAEVEFAQQTEQVRLHRAQQQAAAKAAAHAQLANIRAVCVDGESLPQYNDVYLHAGEHEGWVHFESEQGMHLYRSIAKRRWYLMSEFIPDSNSRDAYVEANDGLLPVGEQEWKVHVGEAGGWKDQMLTVLLLTNEADVREQTERLGVVRTQLMAERAAALDAALARTRSMKVDEYAGEEFTEMFHGTDSRSAQLIVRSQRFLPSAGGMLGKGVYVTTSREKAETYRVYHPLHGRPNAIQHNDPLPNGDPDLGCVLKFRARMGFCKTLAVGDPLMSSWHDIGHKALCHISRHKIRA